MFSFWRRRKRVPVVHALPVPEAKSADDQRLVSFVDVYGRSFQMPLERWRRDVLEPNLDANWDKPDELYSFVISALRD